MLPARCLRAACLHPAVFLLTGLALHIMFISLASQRWIDQVLAGDNSEPAIWLKARLYTQTLMVGSVATLNAKVHVVPDSTAFRAWRKGLPVPNTLGFSGPSSSNSAAPARPAAPAPAAPAPTAPTAPAGLSSDAAIQLGGASSDDDDGLYGSRLSGRRAAWQAAGERLEEGGTSSSDDSEARGRCEKRARINANAGGRDGDTDSD